MTLYTALVTLAKAAAPMIPFMSEEIYQNLVRSLDKTAPESVHLCDFPTVQTEWIDKELEASMDEVLKIVTLGRSARSGSNLKNRQPLSKMYVCAENALNELYLEIIEDELNLKEVEFTANIDSLQSYNFKPQMRTLGPKFGKKLGAIRTALTELDGNAAKKQLDTDGVLRLTIDGEEIGLAAEDLLIETKQKEGLFTLTDNGITVALDTTLTEELILEGYVREIVSKVQTMRKEAGFEVTDHIIVSVNTNEKIQKLATENADAIIGDVLADALVTDPVDGYTKEWDINGETVELSVIKQ
jgi:isoleucyl-tRNA synthetase